MKNKVKKCVSLDPVLSENLEQYCQTNNLNFSQGLNIALASFLSSGNENATIKEIVKKLVQKL